MKCKWNEAVTNGLWESPFEVEKMDTAYGLFILIWGINELRGEDSKHSQNFKNFETVYTNNHKTGFTQIIGDQEIIIQSNRYLVKKQDGTFVSCSESFLKEFALVISPISDERTISFMRLFPSNNAGV